MSDVFASMPFGEGFDSVWHAIQNVATQHNLSSYRTDQEHLAKSIPDAVWNGIKQSRFVVADLTGNNPNVFNEVGLAQALGKPLILFCQESPTEIAFNLRSLQILRYNRTDLVRFRNMLKSALSEAASPSETLRAMLVPSSLGYPTLESRFVIAASPLSYRRAVGRSGGYRTLRRTSSDYVGVRGILRAFGLLFGFDTLPDIVDPEDHTDDVLKSPMNIYCIASPKANRWTRNLLDGFHKQWVPRIEFRADASSRDLKNVRASIFCDSSELFPPGWPVDADGDRYARDFGVIVRGPNPFQANKMAVVIAGRSSLGTEGASIAFTEPTIVERIRKRLQGHSVELEDHRQPFWVVVSMNRAIGDGQEEAVRDSLRVHQVDVFQHA